MRIYIFSISFFISCYNFSGNDELNHNLQKALKLILLTSFTKKEEVDKDKKAWLASNAQNDEDQHCRKFLTKSKAAYVTDKPDQHTADIRDFTIPALTYIPSKRSKEHTRRYQPYDAGFRKPKGMEVRYINNPTA